MNSSKIAEMVEVAEGNWVRVRECQADSIVDPRAAK